MAVRRQNVENSGADVLSCRSSPAICGRTAFLKFAPYVRKKLATLPQQVCVGAGA